VAGILQATIGKSRYSDMTEEEFEREAQSSSAVGNALMQVQGIMEPSRKVEYVLQQDKRPEGDSAESGDRAPDPPAERNSPDS
jgi:hypothetical protein